MKLRSLEKIDALPEEQRHQLATWLETFTLDRCVELVKEQFDCEICRSTLNRFRKRCENTAYLDTSPDSARARAELINAAASGKPNFSQATVDLLEKQAFDLAHETRDPEAVRALKDLFGLVLKHENLGVRKRMATVQERKTKIREDEFAFKKAEKEQPPLDEQAYAIRLSEIFDQIFSNHPAVKASEALSESSSQTLSDFDSPGEHETTTGELELDPETQSSPETSLEPRSTGGDAGANLNPSEKSVPSAVDNLNSSLSSCSSVQNTAPCETPDPNSVLCTFNSALKDHSIRRWRAYLPRPNNSPDPDGSWRDECPCGHPLPCPAHGELYLSTRYLKPQHPDYATALRDAGIPYYIPTAAELGCSET